MPALSPGVLAHLRPAPAMPALSMPSEGAPFLAYDQITGDCLAHGQTMLEALARANADPARIEVLQCGRIQGSNLWYGSVRLAHARMRGAHVAYRGDARGSKDVYGREITLAPVLITEAV